MVNRYGPKLHKAFFSRAQKSDSLTNGKQNGCRKGPSGRVFGVHPKEVKFPSYSANSRYAAFELLSQPTGRFERGVMTMELLGGCHSARISVLERASICCARHSRQTRSRVQRDKGPPRIFVVTCQSHAVVERCAVARHNPVLAAPMNFHYSVI